MPSLRIDRRLIEQAKTERVKHMDAGAAEIAAVTSFDRDTEAYARLKWSSFDAGYAAALADVLAGRFTHDTSTHPQKEVINQ